MSKALLIAGAALAVVFFAGFAYQQSEESSKNNEAKDHLAVASTLELAVQDGVAAGALLTTYVETGDEALLPQMQDKTDQGVRGLTSAITQAGGDPNSFVQTGSQIVQRSGEVIALRQAGDVAGAAAVLTTLGEDFTAFIALQQEYIADERAESASATASADDAGQLASWFLAAAIALTIGVTAGAAIAIVRRSRGHHPAGAVSA
jgi:hypothetical protein